MSTLSLRLTQGVCFFTFSVCLPSYAIDVVPSGQLQLQADYISDSPDSTSNWGLSSPNSRVGLTAIEETEIGLFIGVWQVGVDPVADETQSTLIPEDAYLNWRQGTLSAYAGRLPSLEYVMLVDLTDNQSSQAFNGLAIGNYISRTENEALRLDVASGESFVLSAQILIDDSEDLTWRTGAILRTSEGTAALTIRSDPGEDIVWGNQVTFLMGDWSLAGAMLYDDEILAWDLIAQASLQSMVGFISYDVIGDLEGQWAIGAKQSFSDAVLGFSEVTWDREGDGWSWSTGLKMTF